MFESFLTILLVGFFAGFVFAMPIAGPISIIITSNALKGNINFCYRTAFGGSIVEIFYVLVAVFGLSLLLSVYYSFIPYMLMLGAFFLLVIGIKISRTNLKLDDFDKSINGNGENSDKSGGFRTGLIINLTNPSFFFGILTSSFLVLSFASSVGLNTGGLDLLVYENVTTLQEIAGDDLAKIDSTYLPIQENNSEAVHSSYTLLLSATYAFALGLGGFTWLIILARVLLKYRERIKISVLNWIIRILGLTLCGIGIFLFWKSISILSD
jgi:threonine/homoserine/homoserine lactone efflux protein